MKAGLRGIQVQTVTRGPRREKRSRGQKGLIRRLGRLSEWPTARSIVRLPAGPSARGCQPSATRNRENLSQAKRKGTGPWNNRVEVPAYA